MDSITLGEIGLVVTFLVGLISGVGFLHKHLKKWMIQSLESQFAPIHKEIRNLNRRIDSVDMQACKNYLVSFLSDVEKRQPLDEIQRERFWEQYQYYTEHGGNSYIKHKVEKLKKRIKFDTSFAFISRQIATTHKAGRRFYFC
ncbi:MAG: hypothetical protein NC177_02835 [Ruminococcus flavefaciens]|nr:hypothetical protein [Ruminococcus flavefaciens]